MESNQPVSFSALEYLIFTQKKRIVMRHDQTVQTIKIWWRQPMWWYLLAMRLIGYSRCRTGTNSISNLELDFSLSNRHTHTERNLDTDPLNCPCSPKNHFPLHCTFICQKIRFLWLDCNFIYTKSLNLPLVSARVATGDPFDRPARKDTAATKRTNL